MNGDFDQAPLEEPRRIRTGSAGVWVLLIAIALQLLASGRSRCEADPSAWLGGGDARLAAEVPNPSAMPGS